MPAIILLLSFYLGAPLGLAALVAALSIRSALYPRVLRYLISLFPIYLLIIHLSRFYCAGQGIDFAIFSQTVHNFSTYGRLETSLIDYRPHNFLTHHLSPYLYLLGLINIAVGHAPILLISSHVLIIGISIYLLYQLFNLIHQDKEICSLLVSLAILLPSSRLGLTWEVRDEIYAFPLILLSYMNYLRKNHRLCALTLISLSIFKETLLLFSSFFALMALVQTAPRKLYAFVLAFSIGVFILYTNILPMFLFTSTFDYSTRIGGLSDIFSLAKLKWFLVWSVPLLPLLFCKPKLSIIPLIPLIPLVGSILISNFPPMSNPHNYYSFLPSQLLLITLASQITSPRKVAIYACLILAVLPGPRIRIQKEVDKALKSELHHELNSRIGKHLVVIADDYIASLFYDHPKLIRLHVANRNIIKFDRVVTRQDTDQRSPHIKGWSRKCDELDGAIIYCAIGKFKNAP